MRHADDDIEIEITRVRIRRRASARIAPQPRVSADRMDVFERIGDFLYDDVPGAIERGVDKLLGYR